MVRPSHPRGRAPCRGGPMGIRSPQLIRVSDEQIVLKRGVHELLISGPEAAKVAGMVVDGLRDAADLDDLLTNIPESLRPAAEQLLRTLRARRLVNDGEVASPEPGLAADSPQRTFFSVLEAATD